jgi:predicted nucleic acid-binding protein
VKLLLDTSVWVEHLRHGILDAIMPALHGRFMLRMDVVAASELMAGCRTKKERLVVTRLCAPHVRTGRLLCLAVGDFDRAATALSRLRVKGRSPSGSKAALLDALIVSLASREGALVVTKNLADFTALSAVMPARVEAFDDFKRRVLS